MPRLSRKATIPKQKLTKPNCCKNPAVSSTHGTCAIETQFYKHSSLCLNSKKGSQMQTTDRT